MRGTGWGKANVKRPDGAITNVARLVHQRPSTSPRGLGWIMFPTGQNLFAPGEIKDDHHGGEGNQRQQIRRNLSGREPLVEWIAGSRPLIELVV